MYWILFLWRHQGGDNDVDGRNSVNHLGCNRIDRTINWLAPDFFHQRYYLPFWLNNEDTNSITWRFARCEWIVNCRTSVGNPQWQSHLQVCLIRSLILFTSLVDGFNPSEKYESKFWIFPQIRVKIKKSLSCHHLVLFCCKSPLRHGKTLTEWPLLSDHSTPHLTPASWVLHPNLQPSHRQEISKSEKKSLVTEQWYIPIPATIFLHSKPGNLTYLAGMAGPEKIESM